MVGWSIHTTAMWGLGHQSISVGVANTYRSIRCDLRKFEDGLGYECRPVTVGNTWFRGADAGRIEAQELVRPALIVAAGRAMAKNEEDDLGTATQTKVAKFAPKVSLASSISYNPSHLARDASRGLA